MTLQRLGRFEQSHGFFADWLIGAREGLAHAEIERQLNYFEMVIFAAGFLRQSDDLREREIVLGLGRVAIGVPRGRSVHANLAGGDHLLQGFKCFH